MCVANLQERGRSPGKIANVDAVGGTPGDKLYVELLGGIVVEVPAEGVNVEDNETVLACQWEDLANQVGLDTRLIRPRLTREGKCHLITVALVERADELVIAGL